MLTFFTNANFRDENMATQALPDPSDFNDSDTNAHGSERSGEQSSSRAQRKEPFPSESECLSKLNQLAGVIALGVLSPAQASAIRASYQEILRYHRHNREREERGSLTDQKVLDLADKSPEILNMLEGFLTPEQVDLVMKPSVRKPH